MMQMVQDFGSDKWELKDDDVLIESCEPMGGSWAVKEAAGTIVAMRPDEKTAVKALTQYGVAKANNG